MGPQPVGDATISIIIRHIRLGYLLEFSCQLERVAQDPDPVPAEKDERGIVPGALIAIDERLRD